MRIPKVNNYNKIIDKELMTLPEIEFSKPSYILYEDKDRMKFIKTIESLVRESLEYKELVEYLRSGLDMSYCAFFNNVSKAKARRVKIELHHIPFSLFDIVNIVLRKWESEDIPLDPIKIAEEVMELHYRGIVGLIPLSETVHQLYHRGDIFIPLQYVDRGFIVFCQEYREYLKEYEDILAKLIQLSKEFDLSNNAILKKRLIYIDNQGYESIPARQKLQ